MILAPQLSEAAQLFEELPRAKVLASSALFRLSEAARVFEELPRATIFSVLCPDAGDITPMLLSYTIEINYKQFTECIPGGAHGRRRGEECEAAPEDASTATDDLSGGKMHPRPSTSPPPHARDHIHKNVLINRALIFTMMPARPTSGRCRGACEERRRSPVVPSSSGRVQPATQAPLLRSLQSRRGTGATTLERWTST